MSPSALVRLVPGCAIKRELQSLRATGKWRGGGRQGEVQGEITSLGIARGGYTGDGESRSERYIRKAACVWSGYVCLWKRWRVCGYVAECVSKYTSCGVRASQNNKALQSHSKWLTLSPQNPTLQHYTLNLSLCLQALFDWFLKLFSHINSRQCWESQVWTLCSMRVWSTVGDFPSEHSHMAEKLHLILARDGGACVECAGGTTRESKDHIPTLLELCTRRLAG